MSEIEGQREHGRKKPRGEEEQAELPVRYLHANGETRFARRWSGDRPGRRVTTARMAAGKGETGEKPFISSFRLCCHLLSPLTLRSTPGRALRRAGSLKGRTDMSSRQGHQTDNKR
ncbi:hypothetical protein FQN60_003843 [Etheostoma spectabile]|uniref:Uncharacterized protein n=1 Tax=Etheostoma spectabile TaxID=54343 RepID=A0A5J5CVI0_9PERO|nr:hypothetical protein FQN60_003843 [Etheostoma spectabile]